MAEGRVVDMPEMLATPSPSCGTRRARWCPTSARLKDADEGARKVAQAAAGSVFDTAERIAAHSPFDVTWVAHDRRRVARRVRAHRAARASTACCARRCSASGQWC